MSKNESATKEFLSQQLWIERERLVACQENLQIHKELLHAMMGGQGNALQKAHAQIDKLL